MPPPPDRRSLEKPRVLPTRVALVAWLAQTNPIWRPQVLRKTTFLLAAISAMLCLGFASLAYAGEDDDEDEPPAPQQTQTVPPPPAPEPAPQPAPSGGGDSNQSGGDSNQGGADSNQGAGSPTSSQTTQVADTQVSAVPVGGVQAGGGGTAAADGSSAGLLGLGGLVLIATAGGGFVLRRRPDGT
jgi:hypothetical protein